MALVGFGCGADDDGTRASATTAEAAGTPDLPAADFAALETEFGPIYQGLGMTLTRGAVVDLALGPHLQLYVEPPGPYTPEQYLASLVPTTAAAVPYAMERYPGLASIDVCQEPPPGVDDAVSPAPETVVFFTRGQADSIDWSDPTVAALIAAVDDVQEGGFGDVRVSDAIAALPEYQQAVSAAG